ncbi:unnamed protein product [Lasius platythorax]|uniref:DDE Tnp4 domain-containing protein n=1 Tax=Lasius platythorax TaxID=488582 RepID=A0AAV2NTU9_9HYME
MGDVESYCHTPAPERRAARRLCARRRGKGGRARRSQLKIGRNVQFLPSSDVDEMIPHVIIACTVLHNICLDGIDENDVEDFIQEGIEMEIEEAYAGNIRNEEAGEVKRQYLCAIVAEA